MWWCSLDGSSLKCSFRYDTISDAFWNHLSSVIITLFVTGCLYIQMKTLASKSFSVTSLTIKPGNSDVKVSCKLLDLMKHILALILILTVIRLKNQIFILTDFRIIWDDVINEMFICRQKMWKRDCGLCHLKGGI